MKMMVQDEACVEVNKGEKSAHEIDSVKDGRWLNGICIEVFAALLHSMKLNVFLFSIFSQAVHTPQEKMREASVQTE